MGEEVEGAEVAWFGEIWQRCRREWPSRTVV